MPDLYSYLDEGEKESDYPLKWDEIQPARYRTWDAPPALDKLRASSKARVATNPSFKVMDEMVKSMRKRKDETTVSLKLSTYRAEQQESKAISDRYEAAQKTNTALAFSPLAADVRAVGGDTVKVNRAARFTKSLKKDITIGEAVAVIQDEINH